MQPYSDYEIAQRLIEQRQNKKIQLQTSLFILAVSIFVILVGFPIGACAIPIAGLAFLVATVVGIEWYYLAPEHSATQDAINQEIEWLLGEDWQTLTNPQVQAFAQDRIRKRQIRKWRLLGHLLLFIPINGAIFISGVQWLMRDLPISSHLDNGLLLLTAFVWSAIFISDVRATFPSKQSLEKREVHFGKSLKIELERLQPEKPKVREKLKRGKYYIVGDDGELEEVEDEINLSEDKPKRMMRDGE